MQTVKEALKSSIAHWEKMKEAAKRLPPTDFPDSDKMEIVCGESWYSGDCALCTLFLPYDCDGCPLFERDEYCDSEGSLWRWVSKSATWKDWIANADKMLAMLRELEEDEE